MLNCKGKFFAAVPKKPIFIKDPITRIFLLDDCHIQQYLLSQILKELGADVECASSITEALGYIKSSKRIDLIISDIELSGETGLDFIKILKEHYKLENSMLPPTIAISSNDCYKKMALEARFDAFLKKPISKQDCINILSQLNIEGLNNEPKSHLCLQ